MCTTYLYPLWCLFTAAEASRWALSLPEGWFQAQPVYFRRELGGLGDNFAQVPHAHQIVGRASEAEHPVHLENSTMPYFPQQCDRFQPAETFFDALPLDLADAIACMLSRAIVNGASASPFVVLRHVRSHLQIPALGHKVECVIALVPTCGHPLRSRKLLQHHQRRVALRCPVGLEYFARHDQSVAILHQQVSAGTQLVLLARAFARQLGLGIGLR